MSGPDPDHSPTPDPLAIFIETLEQGTPEARAAYLTRACAGAPGLRARLEALLAAHEQAGSFLESPALPPTELVTAESPAVGPGALIGPYKLLHEIGEGGMGTVFLAEQE